jgi:hypothetical protein
MERKYINLAIRIVGAGLILGAGAGLTALGMFSYSKNDITYNKIIRQQCVQDDLEIRGLESEVEAEKKFLKY